MIGRIVCGGPDLWLPKELDGFVIGVDRGALYLVEQNIKCQVAIGDFDSVSFEEKRIIKNKVKHFVELSAEKDMTDCEAAIQYAVANGCRELHLYGVTGGRFDHQFAVVTLVLKYVKRDIRIFVENAQNKWFVLSPGKHEIEAENKRYLSFFALEAGVNALTLAGVKYPLNGYELRVDDALCVSNEVACGQIAKVSFDAGYLLVVQSAD